MSVLTAPLRLVRRRDEAAELEALVRRWSRTPAGDARVDAHVRMMLRRCGVTSGRVLQFGSAPARRAAFGPGYTCHHLERLCVSDLGELKDGTFDVVLSIDIEPPQSPGVAAQIARILAPGGLAYASTRDPWAEFDRLFDALDTIEAGVDQIGPPRAFHAAVQPGESPR